MTVAVDYPGVPMRIDFTIPALDVGGYFTYRDTPTMMAYDSANVLLATAVGAYSSNYTGSGNPPNEYLSVSAGTGSLISYVTVQTPTGPDSFVVDDLTITPVPEPATLSLLALGGLALLRRRKR